MIGIFMNQIMQGKDLTIFGDGSETWAFSYIDDVAIPIANCVNNQKSWNNVFNIGADNPYSVNELARIVYSKFSVPVKMKYLRHEMR